MTVHCRVSCSELQIAWSQQISYALRFFGGPNTRWATRTYAPSLGFDPKNDVIILVAIQKREESKSARSKYAGVFGWGSPKTRSVSGLLAKIMIGSCRRIYRSVAVILSYWLHLLAKQTHSYEFGHYLNKNHDKLVWMCLLCDQVYWIGRLPLNYWLLACIMDLLPEYEQVWGQYPLVHCTSARSAQPWGHTCIRAGNTPPPRPIPPVLPVYKRVRGAVKHTCTLYCMLRKRLIQCVH